LVELGRIKVAFQSRLRRSEAADSRGRLCELDFTLFGFFEAPASIAAFTVTLCSDQPGVIDLILASISRLFDAWQIFHGQMDSFFTI
jgi:hypothetical protein